MRRDFVASAIASPRLPALGDYAIPVRERLVAVNRAALILAFSTLLLALLWGINAARYLRPSADDYCIGVRGNLGIVGGFVNDWQTFSGFAVPSFVTNALLGVPLAELPLWVALAIPFLAAALAVGAAAYALVRPVFAQLHDDWRLLVLVIPAVMTLWWGYLWSSYSPSGRPAPSDVTLGLTHWQNLNTGYVIPIALVVLLGTWVLRRDFSTWQATVVAPLLTGVVAGFAGPATALAVLIFVPTAMVGLWGLNRRYWLLKGLTVGLTTLVSLVVSLNAPGTLARSDAARSDADTSVSSALGWFGAVVPDGFIAWFAMYWQWRSLLVVGVAAAAVYMLRLVVGKPTRVLIGRTWLAITVFAWLLSTSTIVTDTLAYGAYWHQSNTTVLTFLSLLLLGVGVGGWLPLTSSTTVLLALPVVLVALGLSVFAAMVEMSVSITERHAAWEAGSAPIEGAIEDREVEWIGNCWEQLEAIRQGR